MPPIAHARRTALRGNPSRREPTEIEVRGILSLARLIV